METLYVPRKEKQLEEKDKCSKFSFAVLQR